MQTGLSLIQAKVSFLNYLFTFISILLCISMAKENYGNIAILFASFYLILISIIDAKTSRIPNKVTLSFFVFGFLFNIIVSGWTGLVIALAGAGTGLGLMLLPFLLGGMGAGDVKALAALGTLVGPSDILQIFLYMGISGGIIGLIYFFCFRSLY